jgi:hypothetical protein
VNGSKPYGQASVGRAPRRRHSCRAVQWFLSPHPSPLPWGECVFSVSRFHVPQGRSKIVERFIAGLWREHNTSPVRDERMHRSSLISSVAPPGLGPFSTRNPRLKPWAAFGRPYRDFGIRALPSFNTPSTTAFSRCEGTGHTTRSACAGPTVKTYWGAGEPDSAQSTIQTLRLSTARCALFPLLEGEGQGEGETVRPLSCASDHSRTVECRIA